MKHVIFVLIAIGLAVSAYEFGLHQGFDKGFSDAQDQF